MTLSFTIEHNVEVAHRLTKLPGKCQQIHGHSMWVTLTMSGDVDERGLVGGVDFGDAKRQFRAHLDMRYDHHLLLNQADELVALDLPGVVTTPNDPTVEHLAALIGWWSVGAFPELSGHTVHVQETRTNGVTWTRP